MSATDPSPKNQDPSLFSASLAQTDPEVAEATGTERPAVSATRSS